MLSDEERKEQRRLKSKEYEQRNYRKEKSRMESKERCRRKKLIKTAALFGELTLEELLIVSALRCNDLGISFEANEKLILTAMHVLHGCENVQRSRINDDISEQSTVQTSSQ